MLDFIILFIILLLLLGFRRRECQRRKVEDFVRQVRALPPYRNGRGRKS